MKNSFVFYKKFQDEINKFPINEQLDLYKAISKYALDGVEPKFEGLKLTLWMSIKVKLDKH